LTSYSWFLWFLSDLNLALRRAAGQGIQRASSRHSVLSPLLVLRFLDEGWVFSDRSEGPPSGN
jgi:hypothetical protein